MTNPLVFFTLRQARPLSRGRKRAGSRAQARRGSRLRLRRARHLRALPGRGRRRLVLQARHRIARRPRHRLERGGGALCLQARRTGRAAAASAARRRSRATSWSTCRRTARFTARSCASAPRRTPSRSIPSCASHYVEVASRTCTTPPAISAACRPRWPSNGGIENVTAGLPGAALGCRRRCAQGDWSVTVAVPPTAPRNRGDLARPARAGLRARRRYRLDHHRRPSDAISSPAR